MKIKILRFLTIGAAVIFVLAVFVFFQKSGSRLCSTEQARQSSYRVTNKDWKSFDSSLKEAFIVDGLAEIKKDQAYAMKLTSGWDQGWDVLLALDARVDLIEKKDPDAKVLMMDLLIGSVKERLSRQDVF